MKSLLLALCLAGLATGAVAQDSSGKGVLTLKGPSGEAASLTAADVAALPRVSVAFDAHG